MLIYPPQHDELHVLVCGKWSMLFLYFNFSILSYFILPFYYISQRNIVFLTLSTLYTFAFKLLKIAPMVSKLFQASDVLQKAACIQAFTCLRLVDSSTRYSFFPSLNLSHGFISIKVQTIQYLSENERLGGKKKKNPKNENRFRALELCFFSLSILSIM